MRTSSKFSHTLEDRSGRLLTTHVIVSLLKACNLTVVGIECDDAAFQRHFKSLEDDCCRDRLHRFHLFNVISRRFFQGFFQNFASKMTHCIIFNYLMLLLANLSYSFF